MLSCCVRYEELTYPKYDTPLMEAFGGAYESVYVVLHPFVRVPDKLAWKATMQYPSDEQILSVGAKCGWAEVVNKTKLGTCARLDQALLTSIGSLDKDLRDYAASGALKSLLETESIWMPGEGRFEALLQMDLLDAFEAAGESELMFVPEFPETDPVQRIGCAGAEARAMRFFRRGERWRRWMHRFC